MTRMEKKNEADVTEFFMLLHLIGISGGIVFSGCPSVTACVPVSVCPVSMTSYKPMDRISPKFGP